MDAKIDAVIGVSIPQFLTRNETILPSTFQYYNKGSVWKTTGYGNHATLEILGGRGDQNGALSYYASYW